MRCAAYLSLALVVAACSSPHAPAPRAPQQAAPARRPGARAELPGYGLSAEFPSAPKLSTSKEKGQPTTQLFCKDKQDYALWSLSTGGKDRAPDEKWFEAVRSKLQLEKRADFELRSFRGLEIGGKYKGQDTLVRLLAVGDTLFMAEVEAKPGKLDVPAAERFFASLELALPWRIYASPTTGFSARVPAHSIVIDKTERRNDEGRASTLGFFVGGSDGISYWTSAQEIAWRSEDVSADRALDAAIDSMREDGSEIVFQAPVQIAGMRGREFLSRKSGEVFRGRIWIGEHFVYMLMVGAKNDAALRTDEVSKFFDSLVWY